MTMKPEPVEPQSQSVMLPVSTTTMQQFLSMAQERALFLSLKVDELQLMVTELQRQLANAKKD